MMAHSILLISNLAFTYPYNPAGKRLRFVLMEPTISLVVYISSNSLLDKG